MGQEWTGYNTASPVPACLPCPNYLASPALPRRSTTSFLGALYCCLIFCLSFLLTLLPHSSAEPATGGGAGCCRCPVLSARSVPMAHALPPPTIAASFPSAPFPGSGLAVVRRAPCPADLRAVCVRVCCGVTSATCEQQQRRGFAKSSETGRACSVMHPMCKRRDPVNPPAWRPGPHGLATTTYRR